MPEQHLFGFVRFVVQAVETRQPQGGFLIRRVQAMHLAVLRDGFAYHFRLHAGAVDIAEAAQVNARQQAVRGQIVGIALQDFIGFHHGVVHALGLPIHFRQALADDRGLWVNGVGLLVGLDGFAGQIVLAGQFILLLVNMPERQIVVSLCARRGLLLGGWSRLGG